MHIQSPTTCMIQVVYPSSFRQSTTTRSPLTSESVELKQNAVLRINLMDSILDVSEYHDRVLFTSKDCALEVVRPAFPSAVYFQS